VVLAVPISTTAERVRLRCTFKYDAGQMTVEFLSPGSYGGALTAAEAFDQQITRAGQQHLDVLSEPPIGGAAMLYAGTRTRTSSWCALARK
jgi:hypothetical protein